jgi:hypothetical protein
MSAEERNKKAKQYVTGKLDYASTLTEDDFSTLKNYHSLAQTLDHLINVKAMGFRGVVATAITGLYLSNAYDPLKDFYSCNPRSIFEKGIFYAFENRIPCGKSDPLNVAKNINVLDDEWANGKRPHSSAQAAVNYLRNITNANGDVRENLINFFFFRLLKYSEKVKSISISIPNTNEISNQAFSNKLISFTLDIPESGTIPQLVIFILLKKVYENSATNVEGGNESVFGTNTTSKKPADIWLEVNYIPISLFEVTVKVIDEKRLDDCLESLQLVNMLDKPIHFICRIPKDIESLSDVKNSTLNYKGKNFNFVDIASFISSLCTLLTTEQINEIRDELTSFIEKIDRPVKTKEGWNNIFKS